MSTHAPMVRVVPLGPRRAAEGVRRLGVIALGLATAALTPVAGL